MTLSVLEQSEHDHWESLKEESGVIALYHRGDEGIIELTVVPAKRAIDNLSFDGDPMHERNRQFIVNISDMNEFYPPKNGDIIELKDRTIDNKFTVTKTSVAGAYHFDCGNYGVMCRIHTEKM